MKEIRYKNSARLYRVLYASLEYGMGEGSGTEIRPVSLSRVLEWSRCIN